MSWRWLRVRLWLLLTGDTYTAILYQQDPIRQVPTPTGPRGRQPLTPEGVSRLLGSWATRVEGTD